MSEPQSPRPGDGHEPNPAEIMRDSAFRGRFLAHTLDTRRDDEGRALLDSEWRYIGPLLGGRSAGDTAVLDLACGSGFQTLAWAERGFRTSGLDFDRELLVAGRERVRRAAPGAPAPTWVCGDATRLPYADRSFDLVFNNSLLEHVPDWRAVLRETARVLRPGGVFVMYTCNRTCPRQQEVNHFPFYSWLPDPVQRRVMAWIMEHRRDLVNFTDFPAINWFTFPGMRRAFREAGLEPHDRLDLIARRGEGGRRGAAARLMSGHPALKWPYYFYAVSMALYGVRRAGA